MEPRWTIYCHTHIESGRRYVGLTTKTMMARWNGHVYASKQSKGSGKWHFPNAIRKYGPEAFSHEVLEVCHSLEVANLSEECWICLLDTRNPANGFNLAKGGGWHPTDIRNNPWDRPEYRDKLLSVTQSPEARLRVSEAVMGRVLSPEVRAAISDRMAGRPRTSEERRKVAASLTGRVHGEETRRKISEARKRQVISQETRGKISRSNTGKCHTPESRARMSEVQKRKAEERAGVQG